MEFFVLLHCFCYKVLLTKGGDGRLAFLKASKLLKTAIFALWLCHKASIAPS